jgi:hypothetical protein
MSVSATVSAGLYSLPDDVLRALAKFAPLSDLLVLVKCSRHIRMVLQSQLNRCLDQLFAVTHLEEHCAQVRRLPFSSRWASAYQPQQQVVDALFGGATLSGNFWNHFFVEVNGRSTLSLFKKEDAWSDCVSYYISGETKPVRVRFASWLRYRCEKWMAAEANGNSMVAIGGVTSDL